MPGDEPLPFEAWPGPLVEPLGERLRDLASIAFVRRLWKRDPTLWKPGVRNEEASARRLGWLGSVGIMQSAVPEMTAFSQEIARAKIEDVVVLETEGTGVAPSVFASVLGPRAGRPRLTVLDAADPAAILDIERSRDLCGSLFVISSPTGALDETVALLDHFAKRLAGKGVADPASRFVAITDPGSALEKLARDRTFRRVFLNPADIGPRYSALSFFGMVPAALLGVNLDRLLDRAARVSSMCGPSTDVLRNPGAWLGALLAEAAIAGRDKITFILSPEIAPFGAWLEQIVAAGSGHEGPGLLPIVDEAPARPEAYGPDRLFIYLKLRGGLNEATDSAFAGLKETGHPLVRLDLDDRYDIAAEILKWEIAVATSGGILGINPFAEPDADDARGRTRDLMRLHAEEGRLPEREPFRSDGALALHAAIDRVEKLRCFAAARGWPGDATGILAAHLRTSSPRGYVALLAFVSRMPGHDALLGEARRLLRDRLRLAVTLDWGPGYLEATGQYHKGGPDTGVFILITHDDAEDLEIPGRSSTFGALKRAQALGDLAAMAARQRRILRVHLSGEIAPALEEFGRALRGALDLLSR